MDRFLRSEYSTKKLNRTVCNHFIRIHVGRRSGARLKNVDDELIVELSLGDFGRCLLDGVCNLAIQQAQIVIRFGGGKLDFTQRSDEFTGKSNAADWKILDCS